jgi:photosystem II stability/assembly factor-like uncharacterized protein
VWVTGKLGTARASTDGGANWDPVNLRLDSRSDVRSVCLVSPDSVVLAGGGGFVRISDDGGDSWEFPVQPLFGSASAACFVGQKGWVANGDTMTVIRTTNGGATWSLPTGTTRVASWIFKFNVGIASDKRGNTFSINWQNPNTIYCMILNRVYVSRNGGDTWSTIGNTVSNSLLVNGFIVSPSDSTLWVAAVTNPDRIVRSTNSGSSWSTRRTDDFSEYGIPIEMDPDRPDTLYFGPDGDSLFRSTDFGDTWSAYSHTTFRSPCDIAVIPESDSLTILVGDGITSLGNGELWRTTNGSLTFTRNFVTGASASEIPTISVSRLRNNRAFLSTWSGPDAMVSQNEGLSWSVIGGLTGQLATWGNDIAKDDPNVVVYDRYSQTTSFLSYDGGTNWDTIPKSGANYGVFALDRGNVLKLQSTGIFKLKHVYTYTPSAGAQSLSLVVPNGGEVWDVGSEHTITWTATNVAMAVIEYRVSPGDPWIEIATVPGYQASYDWLVPDAPTFEAQVRVRDAWDSSPSDASSSAFTIAAPLISATPDPLDLGPVQIGNTGVAVVTIENPGTATLDVTSASVATPFFALSRSSLSVAGGDDDTLTVLFDPAAAIAYEDTLVLIHNAEGSPLRIPIAGVGIDTTMLDLTVPDGGEVWAYGTSHRIEWASALVDSVKIEFRVLPAQPWVTLAETFPADSGGFTWQIPDAPGHARVRITQIGGAAEDSTADFFFITVPQLVVTPSYLNIGLVAVGQSFVRKVTLTNFGTGLLDVVSIVSDDSDFVVDESQMQIAETVSDSLFLTFQPLVIGPDTAIVTFTTNGPESPVTVMFLGEGTSTVDVGGDRPVAFALGQNHPNPFTGVTTIRYALPVRTNVRLDVFDLQGKRVARLVDGEQAPGHYTVPFGAGVRTTGGAVRDVRSGVYFYRLHAGGYTATRKMLLLR